MSNNKQKINFDRNQEKLHLQRTIDTNVRVGISKKIYKKINLYIKT